MMTDSISFQLNWSRILLWATIIIILFKFNETNSSSIDCSKYYNSTRYGGKICGTDGITYANKRYLWCLNHRNGVDIATAHPGCCLPGEERCRRDNIYSPVCGFDGKTWSNLESLRCHNSIYNSTIEKKFEGICDDDCNIDNKKLHCTQHGFNKDGLNPVCASNGFTYQNVAQVKCLREQNNPDLRVLYSGGCGVRKVREVYKDSTTVCEISKIRFEWNPICGNDNETYVNPFVFICAQSREKTNLKVKFRGECESPIYESCKRSKRENYTRTDRVCGNNGVTYDSIHHLRCRTNRDKYLNFKHKGKCIGPNDNPCGAVPAEESRHPICASDDKSYVSIEAMWCANRENNTTLSFRHDGPCLHSE